MQSQLSPNSEVKVDYRTQGKLTGNQRQIDILVRDFIGQYQFNIAIECKDYSRKVDVKKVEEFKGLLDDTGFQKGVLVAANGFTKTAKILADKLDIELYRLVDSRPHKWSSKFYLSSVFTWSELQASFSFRHSFPGPFEIPLNFPSVLDIYDADHKCLGSPMEFLLSQWNNGELTSQPGNYSQHKIFGEMDVFCDNGLGCLHPIEMFADLLVNQKFFSGNLEVKDISGFEDQINGGVLTRAFSLHVISADEIIRDWVPLKVEEVDRVKKKSAIQLVGRSCFDLNAIRSVSFY